MWLVATAVAQGSTISRQRATRRRRRPCGRSWRWGARRSARLTAATWKRKTAAITAEVEKRDLTASEKRGPFEVYRWATSCGSYKHGHPLAGAPQMITWWQGKGVALNVTCAASLKTDEVDSHSPFSYGPGAAPGLAQVGRNNADNQRSLKAFAQHDKKGNQHEMKSQMRINTPE